MYSLIYLNIHKTLIFVIISVKKNNFEAIAIMDSRTNNKDLRKKGITL